VQIPIKRIGSHSKALVKEAVKAYLIKILNEENRKMYQVELLDPDGNAVYLTDNNGNVLYYNKQALAKKALRVFNQLIVVDLKSTF